MEKPQGMEIAGTLVVGIQLIKFLGPPKGLVEEDFVEAVVLAWCIRVD